MSSSIVLIGPADAIPSLRERVDAAADLRTFTDVEALEALDHIIQHKPRIVALDHEFSSTSRGTALVNRIKDDPALGECEVRVIAHDSALNRVAVRRAGGGGPAVALDEPKTPLDQRGTRRAPRTRIKDGVEVLVDGNATMLIDVSRVGVQVLSAKMLKPNQRVRVSFTDGKGVIRCNGSIAWASFEMPKGQPTRYRAGIDITGADGEAVDRFAERNKK